MGDVASAAIQQLFTFFVNRLLKPYLDVSRFATEKQKSSLPDTLFFSEEQTEDIVNENGF